MSTSQRPLFQRILARLVRDTVPIDGYWEPSGAIKFTTPAPQRPATETAPRSRATADYRVCCP